MNNSSVQNELSQRWAQSGLANGDVFYYILILEDFLLNSKKE